MKLIVAILALFLLPAIVFAQATEIEDSPYQIGIATTNKYQDTIITVTNDGKGGAAVTGGGNSASTTGALCANFYAFAGTDGSFLGCCSCPVAPNAVRAITVNSDLAPSAANSQATKRTVVKLLTTSPIAGSCIRSAATAGIEGTFGTGLVAWRANGLTSYPTTNIFGIQTENVFLPRILSAGELIKMSSPCRDLPGNLVCPSC